MTASLCGLDIPQLGSHFRKFSHLGKLSNMLHPTLFEGAVIEIAAKVEGLLQGSTLFAGRHQSIFERLNHRIAR